MNANEFKRKYPDFTGYVHDFSDPSDVPNDVEIARRLRDDLPDKRRIEVYRQFVPAIEQVLPNLDREWEVFSAVVNRAFGDAGAARHWLESVLTACRGELARLERADGPR